MKTVAIIQARTGSTRLPRKVFADIGGQPMLARVVNRLARAARLDALCVATSDAPGDAEIADWCAARGLACVRGPEDDVLTRYLMAARESGADVIVRVTADCPLIDPGVVDAVIALRAETGADYAGNTIERLYPDGLDVEAFTLEALEKADRLAAEGFDRMHVTSFIYRRPEMFSLASLPGARDLGALRWTVDTADDLAAVRKIYAAFGGGYDFGWEQALAVYEADPALRGLNAHVRPKTLEEG